MSQIYKGIRTKNMIYFFRNFIDRFHFSRQFGVLFFFFVVGCQNSRTHFCLRQMASIIRLYFCSILTGSVLLDLDALACFVDTTELWIPQVAGGHHDSAEFVHDGAVR